MNLYIDIGNQRLKWLTDEMLQASDAKPIALDYVDGSWQDSLARQWSQLQSPARVYVASVAMSHVAKALEDLVMQLWGLSLQYCSVHADVAGLVVEYRPLESLGVDRYLALHGAIASGCQNCVVINAGTAVTIDYLFCQNQRHVFAGGMIMPGLLALHDSLSRRTANIRVAQQKDGFDFGLNNYSTIDCVDAGIKAMFLHAVSGVLSQYKGFLPVPSVLLSGGDASQLYAWLIKNDMYDHTLIKQDACLVQRGMHRLFGGVH